MIGDSPDYPGSDAESVQEFFSGLDQSFFTLLQILTGDSWASGIARPILKVHPAMWVYFTIYIAVAVLVLLNLITAIIVENALAMSNDNEQDQLMLLQLLKDV